MTHECERIDRRTAIGALGLGAAALAAGERGAVAAGPARLLAGDQTGWDEAKGEYVLPPLPYAADALEPHIDAETMTIHHDKHHAGYVRGLNAALTALKRIREGQDDPGLIKHWSRQLAFNGSGHLHHTLFWRVMAPPDKGGGGQPGGDLAGAIDRDFGSFERFVAQFKAAAASVEGSGWGWLVYEPTAGRLLVMQAEKHQNLSIWGVVPLMGVDVWEHAYYLKYRNERGRYVDAFMNLVNWPFVSQRFSRLAGSQTDAR